MDDSTYFRQLKAGRDFGVGDPIATQMDNFIYLVGDPVKRECLVVLLSGLVLWLTYGIIQKDIPIIATNGTALLLNTFMLT